MMCARISLGRRRRSNSLFHFTCTFHRQSQVIRQPYIVDRLVVVEASRDSTQPSLACVYLNEVFPPTFSSSSFPSFFLQYRIAVAAFTLHGEGKEGKVPNLILMSTKISTTLTLDLTSKVVRSWKDALEKANAQYQEAKLASACSLENILGRWGSRPYCDHHHHSCWCDKQLDYQNHHSHHHHRHD